jgi:hypothetical protein
MEKVNSPTALLEIFSPKKIRLLWKTILSAIAILSEEQNKK